MKINKKSLLVDNYISILKKNNYILILHQHNMSTHEWLQLKNDFKNIKFKLVHNNVFSQALQKTKYKALKSYIVGPNIIAYFNNYLDSDIDKLFTKYKQNITLLFAFTKEAILQKSEFDLWRKMNKNSLQSKYKLMNVLTQSQSGVHKVLSVCAKNVVLSTKKDK